MADNTIDNTTNPTNPNDDRPVVLKVDHVAKYFRLPTEQATGLKMAFLNWTKGIKGFTEQHVLKDISFEVRQGDFFGIVGRNGSGKSTLLKIFAGLETPDEGRVILNGQDVTDSEPNKRDVNTVFQNYALFPHMTVAANIGYSLKLKKRPKDEIKKAVDDALALVQLSGYGKRMPAELSGGQRQRMAIARAMMKKPEIYVFDDSFSALDMKTDRQLRQNLKESIEDATVIMVAQRISTVLDADRILVVDDGQIVGNGTHRELLDTCPLYREIAEIQLGKEAL